MATKEECVSRAEKKIEAVARMKLLGIFPETIKQFEQEDLVSFSIAPFGAYYWVGDEDKNRIKEFEEKHNALVYTVIRSYTNIGKLDSYLFVSDYKDEEWEMDRNDIKHNQVLAYVYNYDDPIFSEFGSIGIKLAPAAGLIRIW